MPDRHWREGLHQAVEAKEGVPIHDGRRPRRPDHLPELFPAVHEAVRHDAARPCRTGWEIRRVYKLWVVCVPTNRPGPAASSGPTGSFPTEDAKFDAVVRGGATASQAEGRPVLIGTRSVDKSEEAEPAA